MSHVTDPAADAWAAALADRGPRPPEGFAPASSLPALRFEDAAEGYIVEILRGWARAGLHVTVIENDGSRTCASIMQVEHISYPQAVDSGSADQEGWWIHLHHRHPETWDALPVQGARRLDDITSITLA